MLSFRHLTSTAQITRADADLLLHTAREMEEMLSQGKGSDRMHGKILASLFYEPSTRTRLSFESAMLRLGGHVITADGLQFSSMYKGESIEDTIRVVARYSDIICMRHPQEGSAEAAAKVSPIPFINAGDGPGQHPTQALLDLYTIHKERGTLDGVHIAMAGDLRFGRTVHSLTILLLLYPNTRFTFIAPSELSMPPYLLELLHARKVPFEEKTSLQDGLKADVLYMTRIQKERFADIAVYERLKDAYVLRATDLKEKRLTVLHPLPRVMEIATDVDALPGAAYFRQAENGLTMRMALIALMLA